MISEYVSHNANLTLSEFYDYCERCESIQSNVLNDILSINSKTALGVKFGFDDISTVADFQKRVPPMEWSDLSQYAKASEKGESNQMFTDLPELFIITSGTTGEAKIIPESSNGLAVKNSTTNLRLMALLNHFPEIMDGKLLAISNSAVVGKTECGIPYGTASGITLMNAPEKWRKMVSYPLEILKIDDQVALDYALMRFSINSDIRMILSNNAGRLEQLIEVSEKQADDIINDIEHGTISEKFDISNVVRDELQVFLSPAPERAERLRELRALTGRFTPKEYWRELKLISCWLAGSVGRYVKKITPLFSDDVEFIDCGYGATEGKFNIPLNLNEPAAPLAIHSGFFEFKSQDDGRFLAAHQLEDGALYEIYCTTYSGLYRYAMHDIIRVVGFTGTTPNIQFESKTADFANLCGEKISPRVLESVVERIGERAHILIDHWCVVINPLEECYHFCFEISEKNSSVIPLPDEIAILLESELYGDGTLPYPVFRKQGLIKSATVTFMNSGWGKAWFDSLKQPGSSINQVKLPLVCDEIPMKKYMQSMDDV
jgi:hypothetical protein